MQKDRWGLSQSVENDGKWWKIMENVETPLRVAVWQRTGATVTTPFCEANVCDLRYNGFCMFLLWQRRPFKLALVHVGSDRFCLGVRHPKCISSMPFCPSQGQAPCVGQCWWQDQKAHWTVPPNISKHRWFIEKRAKSLSKSTEIY